VKHDRTGKVSPPVFPYPPNATRRESEAARELAAWSQHPDIVSRFELPTGYGDLTAPHCEPLDDIRAGNPPETRLCSNT